MKIVYVLGTSSGGIPHYAAQLANAVSNYADVIVLKPKKTSADEFFSENINVINAFTSINNLRFVDMYDFRRFVKGFFSFTKAVISYKNITKTINQFNPDIVHILDLPPQIQIFIHRINKKYPKIVTFHGIPERKINIITQSLMTFLSSIAMSFWNILSSFLFLKKDEFDRIIVHTQIHKSRLIKMGFSPDKIKVIPHGAFDIFCTQKYGASIEEEKNTILFFGNIVWSKALDVLIDAIPLVAREIPKVKLVIAGDGVIPKRSWEVIKEYKSNFEIHNYFIPNEKVGEFFSRASLVVIPNRSQGGHSGSLTVAYSFGKPVVTTNVGEFPELVRDAGCGLVVPPDNPGALAHAIIELLKNDELRKKMSKNALKKAEELSWDNIAKMHMRVYEEVLNEWGKGTKD